MNNSLIKRISTSAILFAILILVFMYHYFLMYILIITSVIAFLEFSQMLNKIKSKNNKYYKLIFNILFLTYLFLFSSLFFIFSLSMDTKILIYLSLLICISSDIGGLIFGKIFKGPKLTKISPKKTISGSAGSFILSFITVIFSSYFLVGNLFYSKLLVLAFFVSLTCQAGDIFFSYIKRKANVKDTGNILPGHGGVLDRIDGILFGIPFGIMIASIFYI